jgi:hypothetical protein
MPYQYMAQEHPPAHAASARGRWGKKDVDGRNKSGHDERSTRTIGELKSGIRRSGVTADPHFAEPVIGPATSGRTRWLHAGYCRAPVYIELSAICRRGLNPTSIMSDHFSSFVQHKGRSNGFRQTIFEAQQPRRPGHPTDLRAVQRHRPRPRARPSNHLQSLRWNWKSARQDGTRLLIGRLAADHRQGEFTSSCPRIAVRRTASLRSPMSRASTSYGRWGEKDVDGRIKSSYDEEKMNESVRLAAKGSGSATGAPERQV